MKKINILIVEDDNIIAMELQSRLEEHGYGICGPYAYGEQVIEEFSELKVDLILMDINLKGSIDGIQTASIIKEKYRKPIIYLTAFSDKKTLDRAKITEPFGYIIKPFEERELFTNIEMALYKHQMELKLVEREQWLQTTLKSIGDGVIATDIDSAILFMNNVAESLTGWNLEDAVGKKFEEVFHIINEIDRKPCENLVEIVINRGIVVSLANHTILINKEGKEIFIANTASPIKNEDGVVTGCVVIFQDHTIRKKNQSDLEESETKYRTTLESMDDGIYVVDKELNIVLMNNTLKTWAEELGGQEYKNFEGRNLADFKPFVHEHTINETLSVFNTCETHIHEEDFSVNGLTFNSEIKRIPINVNSNDPRLIVIIRNITENKKNIEALKKSRFQLQNILDFTPAIVYIKDLMGNFQLTNKKFEELFNIDNDNIRGKKESDLFDARISEVLTRNDNVVKNEGQVVNYESLILHNDAELHTYLFTKFLIYDSIGNASGVCTIATDISDRKKAEEEILLLNMNLEKRVFERTEQLDQVIQELNIENEKRKSIQVELVINQKQLAEALKKEKELNVMKNDFISMISHEYRTPLTIIQNSASIIDIHMKNSNQFNIEHAIEMITKSVKKMTQLLENTIAYRSAESGMSDIKPEKFDFIALIESIIEESRFSEKEYHSYEFIHSIDNCQMYMDMKAIQHIIGNIISNAAKYSATFSKISIELNEKPSDKVEIIIKDKGIGIPQSDLQNIFEPFYRSSNVQSISGSGLGLSIVMKNVKLIGGEISVESEINKGTTFNLIIPKKSNVS
jgi:PAS domain S-box-containing protein